MPTLTPNQSAQPRLLPFPAPSRATNRDALPHIGRLLSLTQRTLLKGRHLRQTRPAPDARYVGGLVIFPNPLSGRLEASITIAELQPDGLRNALHIVQHLNIPLALPGALAQIVQEVAGRWDCQRLLIASPRVAAPLELPSGVTTILDIPSAEALAPALLDALDLGRVQVYTNDGSREHTEFWAQAVRAVAGYRPEGPLALAAAPLADNAYVLGLALAVEAANRLPLAKSLPTQLDDAPINLLAFPTSNIRRFSA